MKNNVIFQKNLDHYNSKMPVCCIAQYIIIIVIVLFFAAQGNFTVNMIDMKGKMTTLSTMKDTNTTSLYVYQAMVDIPE